jgi:hypothetical protein
MNSVATCQCKRNQAQQKSNFFHIEHPLTAHEHQQSALQHLLRLPSLG